MKGALASLAALVVLSPFACGGGPSSATAPLGKAFVVENGGPSVLVDGILGVRFEEVVTDSRCPVDVNCITSGDASIRISVKTSPDKSPELQLTLHTAGNLARTVDIDSTRALELIDLKPQPRSTVRVVPADYRATLKVTAR